MEVYIDFAEVSRASLKAYEEILSDCNISNCNDFSKFVAKFIEVKNRLFVLSDSAAESFDYYFYESLVDRLQHYLVTWCIHDGGYYLDTSTSIYKYVKSDM